VRQIGSAGGCWNAVEPQIVFGHCHQPRTV
jgi:hypothetical protein